jgi:thymidylate synthase
MARSRGLGDVYKRQGLMGPNYGYNWRNFGSMYNTENGTPLHAGIDQLKNVVDTIKRDPYSRRILLTSYDPMTVSQCVLYPCHTVIAQFHVSSEDILSMFCYIRSSDLLLGLPFNIASSALLLMLIAKITDKIPGKLYITLGDAHVYTAHLDAARLACSRRYSLYNFPIIGLPDVKTLEDIEKLTHSDISLHWYESHGAISAPMIP